MTTNRNTVITSTGHVVRLYLRTGSINVGVLTLATVDDAETIASIWELSTPLSDTIKAVTLPAFLSGLEII